MYLRNKVCKAKQRKKNNGSQLHFYYYLIWYNRYWTRKNCKLENKLLKMELILNYNLGGSANIFSKRSVLRQTSWETRTYTLSWLTWQKKFLQRYLLQIRGSQPLVTPVPPNQYWISLCTPKSKLTPFV